jgi:lipoprotein NlpI
VDAGARATQAAAAASARRYTADCLQEADTEKQIAGCTHLIDDAKQTDRTRAIAHYNRGNARAAKGDQDAAIADYDAAIKLDPKDARAYNNRGTVYRDKGDAERAMADFAEAAKINPRNTDAHYNLGNSYAAKGESDKAIAAYSAAIRADGRNANAYVARAIAQLYAGAAPKAQADLWLAARVAPANAYAVLWLDIAQRRAKRPGTLAMTARRVDMKAWPAPLIKLWRGEIKPDALLAAADNANEATKQAQVCEANFYGGELALLKDSRDEATRMFQAAAKECPQPFLERMAANAELRALGVKVD